MLGFAKYVRQILRVKLGVNLFRSMFTMATKGAFDLTYAFSRMDMEVKAKFKSSLSKVKE